MGGSSTEIGGVSIVGFAGKLEAGSANRNCDSSSSKRVVWRLSSSVSGSLAGALGNAAVGISPAAGFTSKKGARLDKSTVVGFEGGSEGAKIDAGLSDGRAS